MRRVHLVKGTLAFGLLVAIGALIVQMTTGKHQAPATLATSASPYRGSTPPRGLHAPDFSLRSYRGGLVRMRDLRGKVVLVTFLDTKCTDKCPIIASQIGAALPLLPSAVRRQVVALAITVDPRADSPASVRRFLQTRHALGMDFLLGSVKKLRPVWRAFYVVAAADTGSANSHSADARIFNRRGIWVSTLRPGVDLTPRNVVHDLLTALNRSRA
jgi:cytochrome oxidase Cu insertion factor (SCO1/SenC/PrrC family)